MPTYLKGVNIYNVALMFSGPLQYFCLPITSSLALRLRLLGSVLPPSVRHYCTSGWGPSPAGLWSGGGGSFKDAGGRALLYRGTLVPVTPSFHHQRLPVNPAYINFLPGWQWDAWRRQRSNPGRRPPPPSPPPQHLHPYCYLLTSRRVCLNKRCKLWRLLAVTVGLQRGD